MIMDRPDRIALEMLGPGSDERPRDSSLRAEEPLIGAATYIRPCLAMSHPGFDRDFAVEPRTAHVERVLLEYVDHYNRERPHRALGLRAPEPPPKVLPIRLRPQPSIRRWDRLGGIIHEYAWAA